jgi:hypothetical protein
VTPVDGRGFCLLLGREIRWAPFSCSSKGEPGVFLVYTLLLIHYISLGFIVVLKTKWRSALHKEASFSEYFRISLFCLLDLLVCSAKPTESSCPLTNQIVLGLPYSRTFTTPK